MNIAHLFGLPSWNITNELEIHSPCVRCILPSHLHNKRLHFRFFYYMNLVLVRLFHMLYMQCVCVYIHINKAKEREIYLCKSNDSSNNNNNQFCGRIHSGADSIVWYMGSASVVRLVVELCAVRLRYKNTSARPPLQTTPYRYSPDAYFHLE